MKNKLVYFGIAVVWLLSLLFVDKLSKQSQHKEDLELHNASIQDIYYQGWADNPCKN